MNKINDEWSFVSDRYFVLFDFFNSHRQLLLRSIKNDNYDKNIDVIFFDVVYVQLASNLLGINILELKTKPPEIILNSNTSNWFQLNSGIDKYYISASHVDIYENSLDFRETSLGLYNFRGRENRISSSRDK